MPSTASCVSTLSSARRSGSYETRGCVRFGPRRAQALGTWLAALCHARRSELDGFCPTEVLHAFATNGVVQDLVDVGLFAPGEQDGLAGFVVVDYAECNPTKAQGGAR